LSGRYSQVAANPAAAFFICEFNKSELPAEAENIPEDLSAVFKLFC
jgi:hypothetical protein